MDIIIGLKQFFEHFAQGMGSVFFFFMAVLAYVVGYPSRILALVLVFFLLDVATRFYAISVQNRGLINAFDRGKLSSRGFWNGFVTKVIGYFVILVTANFAGMTPEISFIGKGIATVLYLGLFFYEAISNLENLRDAGFVAVNPLISGLRREQEKLLRMGNADGPSNNAVGEKPAADSNHSGKEE